ncbi:MAG: hypothetical protein KatS3mg024_2187 [Armatimonadota bacterium]|nr:MAG: hypothetical protein KatS3mg024_2187 [Armatimonadota bacterium]
MRISRILMLAALPAVMLAWQVTGLEAQSGASKAPAKSRSGQAVSKPAPGQRPGPGMRDWGARREEMYKAIGVTAQQRKQLEAIDEKYRNKAKELRGADLTPEQRRAKMKNLIEARQAEVDKVLTPEQKKKRQQWMEEQRKKRQAEMGQRRERPAGAQGRPEKPAAPRR